MFSDLTQNAVEANATVITVELTQTDREISIRIEDNGKGMSSDELARATDPFYTDGVKHPGRKVGLGIPFLIQTAESTGGSWKIASNKAGIGDREGNQKHGTVVEARFDLTNIDTPPVGDVAGYFRQALSYDGAYEMILLRKAPSIEYVARRSELLEALALADEGSFTDANSLSLLAQYLESAETPADS